MGQSVSVLFLAFFYFPHLIPQISRADEAKPRSPERHPKRVLFYGSLIGAYQFQGPRQIKTSPTSIYDVGEFSGTSASYAAGFEYRFSSELSGLVGGVLRTILLEGGTSSTTASKNVFRVTKEFQGIETGFRYTPKAWNGWGMSIRGEYDQGQSVQLKVLQGPPVDQSDVHPTSIVVLFGGIEYLKRRGPGLYLRPEFLVGVVPSTMPVTTIVEFRLTLVR